MAQRNSSGNIDQYLKSFSGETLARLTLLRGIVHEEMPGCGEKISYAIPTFTMDGKNVIHFAGFDKHIGIYPAPREAAEFKEELKAYKGGKGTVQFPTDQPLPTDLIRRIVRYRLAEHRLRLSKS
ncbi:MAG: hypothetical protein RL220_1593 [Bacteroidota bacterium]|jgi:uncharacterized protein YdhG (YjbR/CyaY superfamily)